MTDTIHLASPELVPAAQAAVTAPTTFLHVDLPGHERFGCAVVGSGRGVVVGRTLLGGRVVGLDVHMEDGRRLRAWPSQVRFALARVPT